jgi:hypothetical protein
MYWIVFLDKFNDLSYDLKVSCCGLCACEIIYNIVCDIGDDVYCVLIDESGDSADKEQMAVIHYVDNEGLVNEIFLGIVHVTETNAKTLKEALE